MARFHDLEVTDIRKTIRDAIVVTLKPQNGSAEAFDFVPGQYLTFRQDIDGQELRRSYSICSGAEDGTLQVGIKKVRGGAFSSWANETLQVGDHLQAMTPMGRFRADLPPGHEHHYLAFAGGSGITPILSILKTTLARDPSARVTLVYANRNVSSIMFREEIEDLKNLYLGRFSVIHVLESDAQEVELFTGRVTEAKCAELFTRWIDIGSVDLSLICGPEPMMLGIAAALRKAGLHDDQIRFELFAAAQPGRLPRPADAAGPDAQDAEQIEAQITLDGATRTIRFDRTVSLLDGALQNVIDAPFACKAGVCSTCKCRIIEGDVEMRTNHALEDYEVEKGFVLSCQSYAVSDRLVVDYDQ